MPSSTISSFEEFNTIVSPSPQTLRVKRHADKALFRQINNGRVAIIDFHTDWSRCSKLSGLQLSDFSETFKRIGVDVYSVNVDEADDVVLEADVRVVCKCKWGTALMD